MTLKRTQVMLLPTNEKANIYLHKTKGLHLLAALDHQQGVYNGSNQHLYFLSDEEIKEGDWVINNLDKGIGKALRLLNKGEIKDKEYSKIIATTDSSLITDIGNAYYPYGIPLPQPSQDFIKVFVEEYNKGNVIEWVDVEYDLSDYDIFCDRWYLKVNSKNEITIRKVKESWSRKEVEEKVREGAYLLLNGTIGDFDKWIAENL